MAISIINKGFHQLIMRKYAFVPQHRRRFPTLFYLVLKKKNITILPQLLNRVYNFNFQFYLKFNLFLQTRHIHSYTPSIAKQVSLLLRTAFNTDISHGTWILDSHNGPPLPGDYETIQKFFGGPGGDFTKKPPGRRRQSNFFNVTLAYLYSHRHSHAYPYSNRYTQAKETALLYRVYMRPAPKIIEKEKFEIATQDIEVETNSTDRKTGITNYKFQITSPLQTKAFMKPGSLIYRFSNPQTLSSQLASSSRHLLRKWDLHPLFQETKEADRHIYTYLYPHLHMHTFTSDSHTYHPQAGHLPYPVPDPGMIEKETFAMVQRSISKSHTDHTHSNDQSIRFKTVNPAAFAGVNLVFAQTPRSIVFSYSRAAGGTTVLSPAPGEFFQTVTKRMETTLSTLQNRQNYGLTTLHFNTETSGTDGTPGKTGPKPPTPPQLDYLTPVENFQPQPETSLAEREETTVNGPGTGMMNSKITASPAPGKIPAIPGINSTAVANPQEGNIDFDRLTDRVYRMLESKIRMEKEMRGW